MMTKRKLLHLAEFIKIGVPIIVCQKFRDDQIIGHFRIVIGLTDKTVIVNDPELKQSTSKIRKDSFLLKWEKCSNEVIGGEFVVILDDKNVKQLGNLPVYEFRADIKDFVASDFNFEP